MNILDTNAIGHIFEKDIRLSDQYFLPPDVKEESEMTELVHNRRLPKHILEIKDKDIFNEAKYLAYYKEMLNKYEGRSFFNMTGFGDVSILAAIHVILDSFTQRIVEQLFDTSEDIFVYTNDTGLIKKINKEFSGKRVSLRALEDIS